MTWINFEEIEPAAIRLPEERKLQNYLLDTAAVAGKVGVESSVNKNNVAMLRQQLIAEGLRLDSLRAPAVFDELQRLKRRFGITAELECFLYRGSKSGASVIKVNVQNYLLLISPELFSILDIDELKFVLGHELAHIAFKNFELKKVDHEGLPSRLILKLMEHSRLAEISADLAGMICVSNPRSAQTAQLKISAGVSSPLLKLDVSADTIQFDVLRSLINDDQLLLEAKASHPCSIIRREAVNRMINAIEKRGAHLEAAIADAHLELSDLIGLLSPATSSEEEWLVVIAAFWVAYSDASFDIIERREVAKICSDTEFSDMHKLGEAQDDPAYFFESMFAKAIKNEQLKKPKKAALIDSVIAVAQSDGEVSDEERVTLFRIADILELDGRFVSHSLSKVK
jgi:Zn-dependent protease with chaperone function/tellurite resistance protein